MSRYYELRLEDTVMEVPQSVWQAIVVFLASATAYLGMMLKNARKHGVTERRQAQQHVEIDYVVLQEHIRNFIDERAEHKSRNVINAHMGEIKARLDNLEGEMSEVKEERRLLYQLAEGFNSLKAMIAQIDERNSAQLLELTRGVARLQGVNDARE